MTNTSTPAFCVLHALRIKGFASVDVLSEMTALPSDLVAAELSALLDAGRAQFRAGRDLWQLTAAGRAAHPELLAADSAMVDLAGLEPHYEAFLGINGSFKALCSDWQLRDGEPNDHLDAAHDADVIERLAALDTVGQPILAAMAAVLGRLAPYGPRLQRALTQLRAGETNMLTGVMCGSYHDIWMELHEDLIVTQGIDRSAEGSH